MEQEKSNRLISLDIFRGITIAGMILVNNPGSDKTYPALEHAAWNGCTPTDLIFPFFLFIVGVAITLSLTKRKERGDDLNKMIFQIFKRSLSIFFIGLFLAAFPFFSITDNGFQWFDFSTIRIPGVLQRIALVYFITSVIFLKTNVKTQAIIAGALLIIYWGLMTLIPVPGVGYPNLEPATNLGAWLDNLILHGHLWKYSKVWDPEGLLSSMPAISTALFGALLGSWLRSKAEPTVKVVWMFIFGNVGLVLGTIWDMWFPLNKSLWTSSYVVFTAGMALQFFGMCYWLVDIKGYKWWTKPFVVYGMNAITVYFLSGVLARILNLRLITDSANNLISIKSYIFNTFFAPFFSPVNASLAFALVYITFWLGIMWIFYAKKIFIKV
jgi:predicted acyltransferase